MEDFIASGRIVTVILAVMALEVAVIGFWLWRRRQGWGLLSFVSGSLAGASLVLALRAALTEAGWLYVAIYLLAALLAHVADIALRMLMAGYATDQSASDVTHKP